MIKIQLKNVFASRRGKILFKNINWALKTAEHWAIIGQTGAGKSSFMDMILGEMDVEKGEILYPFITDSEADSDGYISVADYVSVVKFHDNAINYSQFYYQQRFQSMGTEGVLTVRDFLNKDFEEDISDSSMLNLLKIKDLLDYEIVKLSNGQTRKMYIAKVLLEQPDILVLDNPFLGLDEEARFVLKKVINSLILEGGQQIILICNYADEIPDGMTDILWLEDFKIKALLKATDKGQIEFSDFQLDRKLPIFTSKPSKSFDIAVKMTQVNVKYGDKQVLQNLDWTIKKGEKWALLGGNGSGKSTLLSLLYGDHPQAYANDITLFDRKRGTGESIWDIKKRIGYVSPELHLYFTKHIENFEFVTEGGLHNWRLAKQLFKYYNLTHLLHQDFQSISFGEQRLVLLIRALVQPADLLILDEPFQGLDSYKIGLSKALLNDLSRDKTLIFVTHYQVEIPSIVTQVFRLTAPLSIS
jgi:molybdate transport system ATP-binding protein